MTPGRNLSERAAAAQRREPARVQPAVKIKVTTSRITLDLESGDHRAFKRKLDDMAEELGVSRVTGSSVLRALLEELMVNEQLSASVTERVRIAGEQQTSKSVDQ